jgi:hypothetical protein
MSFSELDDYTSHNTERMDVGQVNRLLMSREYVRQELS